MARRGMAMVSMPRIWSNRCERQLCSNVPKLKNENVIRTIRCIKYEYQFFFYAESCYLVGALGGHGGSRDKRGSHGSDLGKVDLNGSCSIKMISVQ